MHIGSSETEGLKMYTKEEVEMLLKDRFKGKKCDHKVCWMSVVICYHMVFLILLLTDKVMGLCFMAEGKQEWMIEYVKRSKVCLKWLEDGVDEKDGLRKMLDASERIKICYSNVGKEAKAIKNITQVLYVRSQGFFKLDTTHSSQFLGLSHYSGLWNDSNYRKGKIIGVLDTGITSGHLSFHDKGMPPTPSRWKGKCEVVACDNKLIGMRNIVRGSSPVDQQGHGTHTSSTAAGN